MDYLEGRVTLVCDSEEAPMLEVRQASGGIIDVQFHPDGVGRWVAKPQLLRAGSWTFRVRLGNGRFLHPDYHDHFTTPLKTVWLQENDLFDYEPAAEVQSSQVTRIDDFEGRLSPRSLYIYLPRGYDDHPDRTYPVIYMHDGQNVFETFVEDSFAGSWQADLTADRLIREGQMQECIIVGVSHGNEQRIVEYLPHYSEFRERPHTDLLRKKPPIIKGQARKTIGYYYQDIAPFVEENYRVKNGRDFRATCGSSMGGLFSLYFAWECPRFARHHAAMSPSIWITKNKQGRHEILQRLRQPNPPDVRLWIDSGTYASAEHGDDGQVETVLASEILLANGFKDGDNLRHYYDKGADHSEAAWAARLDKVFQFLFPTQ